MSNFDMAFSFTVENEGQEFVNNTNDSGGPTKFGITQAVFEEFFKRDSSPEEIASMSLETAKNIYFEKFWKHLKLDELLSPKISICLFDTAVLYGQSVSSLLAQKTTTMFGYHIVMDGHIGEETISTINEILSEDHFIITFHSFILERIDSVIAQNGKNEVFRKGWTNRADRLLTLLSDTSGYSYL